MSITTYVAASLLACLLGLGWYADHTRTALAAEKIKNTELSDALGRAVASEQRARKALVARQAANAVEARRFKQVQEALSEALQRNKTWSDTDVPPDVQNAVNGPSDGLPERLPNNPENSP